MNQKEVNQNEKTIDYRKDKFNSGTLFVLMGILAFFSGYLPGSFFVEMEPFLFIPIGLSLLLSASSFQKADGN